jgi:hypothetical protein
MKFAGRVVHAMAVMLAMAAPATAQQPFVFSVSAPDNTQQRKVSVHYDAGIGERPFDVTDVDRPEQRLGMQASLGRGVMLLARVGVSPDGQDTRTSQQAEVLYNVLHRRSSVTSLAFGMGMRHESEGINVLTGRIAAGRGFAAWRVDGNALFEKPFDAARDAVDLITTAGIARRVSSAVHLGVEAIGEDLEGFWDPEEAEGGARLLVGPSLRIAPANRSWQLSVAGGPVVHSTQSPRVSTAIRALPSSDGRNGYAVRTLLSYTF